MKILIDECLPRALKQLFREHECRTEMGWSGKKNGELLSLADGAFGGFVTIDQALQYQQPIAGRDIGLMVLVAPSNQIEDLHPLFSSILEALPRVTPGQILRVGR